MRSFPSLVLPVVMALGCISWLAMDTRDDYSKGLQTTIAKSLDDDHEFAPLGDEEEHMASVDLAALQAATSKVAFWEPYLDKKSHGSSQLMQKSMGIMSQCFGRPIFRLSGNPRGSYTLQNMDDALSPMNLPRMAVFTSSFEQAALQQFHHGNLVSFLAVIHDPIDIYLEQYAKAGAQVEATFSASGSNHDNPLVRHLAGIQDNRPVTIDDLNVAKEMLASKFIIGSCDRATETLRRLIQMVGKTTSGLVIGSEPCVKERQSWNQACRRIKEGGQQNRDNRYNQDILSDIKSEHRYDIMLYEESKKIFDEQSSLFQ